jgi:hypothetical protein
MLQLFFLDYSKIMVVLRGYNRWGRMWPRQYGAVARWPIVMDKVAVWPYEWRVLRRFQGPSFPQSYENRSVATYNVTVAAENYWGVLPHILGPGSATVLHGWLRGTLADPEGVSFRFEIFNSPGHDYFGERVDKSYNLPLTGNQALHNKPFSLTVRSERDPLNNWATFDISRPRFCGENWPGPES